MISFNKAKEIVNSNIPNTKSVSIGLSESSNRILAQDIISQMPSPLFDNSAMDGFAVRSSDTKGATKENPISLKLVSESAAGTPSNKKIRQGECSPCMTGATIPEGADSIVMVENTSGFSNKDSVQIMAESPIGNHIRKAGEEIKENQLLINKGTRITTSEIGTMATFGYDRVSVSKKPKVAIFGTGNELIEPGAPLKKGQIYNSNLYVFADLVEKVGAEIVMRDVIKDNKSSLKAFLQKALQSCDVVISSGGVSMGKYDYVREVFMDLGVKEHFWKVAQKPGKPLFFGTGLDTLIFGLPGNPVSSYIGFMIWVWPSLEKMMGNFEINPLTATLSTSFPRESVKKRFLFGKAWMENGELLCLPASKVGSHMISSGLDANCIIEANPGNSPMREGDEISLTLLPWKKIG